jgi:hypothetical protein
MNVHAFSHSTFPFNIISTSLEKITEYSDLVFTPIFLIKSNHIPKNMNRITINFDCEIYFPLKFNFTLFHLTISNCSVLIRDFNFSETIVIENSFVVFDGFFFRTEE